MLPFNGLTSITDDTLMSFSECNNLTTIRMDNCTGIKKSLQTFLSTKNITELSILGVKLPQQILNSLFTSQTLVSLKFGVHQPLSSFLSKFKDPQPNIKKLDIYNWNLDDLTVDQISSHYPNLLIFFF